MMGMSFTQRGEKELSANFNNKFDRAAPITRTDFDSIGVRIKHMDTVGHAEGYLLMNNAQHNRRIDHITTTISNLSMAIDKFESVLTSNSNRKVTLRTCAQALLQLDDVLAQIGQSTGRQDSPRVRQALEYLKRAVDVDPTDSQSLYRYGNLLNKLQMFDKAEEYFLSALESDPRNFECLRAYGLLLESKKLFREAEILYTAAQSSKKIFQTLTPSSSLASSM
eukprot:TRINITY_DN14773_c0_g1_i1.p1 TRINITY_DN14773_c0_g1~~TRINITY_DN14773_c0_g1_i1.p1  ORF type:complete len:223 (+),score=97.03 TRINITY_DN14773_c0_g1_i1:232-900(+)